MYILYSGNTADNKNSHPVNQYSQSSTIVVLDTSDSIVKNYFPYVKKEYRK